jgi:hypothetical protein
MLLLPAGASPRAGTDVATPPPLPASYPAAGELTATQVIARAAPDPAARVVRRLHQFRSDYRRQILLASEQTTGADGRGWFHVDVPMRPNGTTAWIPAGAVALRPTRNPHPRPPRRPMSS